ncbi:MAG TPA: copper chaperone PCu(A)C [Usitatibacter sp.]|nr:copper chaperone PCu(A)C [Usitatibacter sp.]
MKRILLLAWTLTACACAHAQLSAADPWVRATVPGQSATGAFMQLRSTENVKVVGARSPVAGVVQIHEMKMQGGVMDMHAIKELPVAPGTPVTLEPGGYHVMLMDLKKQVREGDQIPITLVVETADRKRRDVLIVAPVRSLAEGAHAR